LEEVTIQYTVWWLQDVGKGYQHNEQSKGLYAEILAKEAK
jgi:hypothetical protein